MYIYFKDNLYQCQKNNKALISFIYIHINTTLSFKNCIFIAILNINPPLENFINDIDLSYNYCKPLEFHIQNSLTAI